MTTVISGRDQPPADRPLVAGQATAGVDPDFEQRLIEGIRPIAQHYLASCLHHLFDRGVFDHLAGQDIPVAVDEVAAQLGLSPHRLRGLLLFLSNEGVVTVEDDRVALTAKGRGYGEFRPWYTMMIGGYSQTVAQLGVALSAGAPYCDRDGRYVAQGSCEISRYDSLPITRSLLERSNVECRQVVDLGCGSGLSLVQLCHEFPDMEAWGAERDQGGYQEAVELVRREGQQERVFLRNCSATDFLREPPETCAADVAVFSYVLQEMLAQDGEPALVALLRDLVERFPDINIVVVEVLAEIDNPAAMRHGLARNFWNPYFLLHYVTEQRLERRPFWESLFDMAGLYVADVVTTDRALDSSGLEIGYLLRRGES